MHENLRLRLHAGVVEVDEIGVQVFERDLQDALHVLAVAGMHEVNALAEGLIAIDHRPAQIIRHEPLGGLGLLGQKRLKGDRAADVYSNTQPVLVT